MPLYHCNKESYEVTDLEVSYLAGLVDGDGSLASFLNQGNFFPTAAIFSTEETFLKVLQSRFGGKLCGGKNGGPKAKDCFELKWSGRSAVSICFLLEPFLILKKTQAKIVTQFSIGKTGEKVPDQERLLRAIYHSQLAELNKRGK